MKPSRPPERPQFSSGPCAKRPGWSVGALADAQVGRSHRSAAGKARIQEVLSRSREILRLPDDYRLALVPASDTGAIEMAMWSLLGPRGVEVLAWDSFGRDWLGDVRRLGIEAAAERTADYGALPDLTAVDFANDVVFTWNGTTSGVCVPNADWIPADRDGLVLCDATSAVFALDVEFPKLDVVTWSWQKVLGGEAAHGMIALSPRAVERLTSEPAPRPLPKIFRMTRADGSLDAKLFEGATINTPSLLCVEDALDGLRWAESVGGLDGLRARTRSNLAAVERWVGTSEWIEFLARDPGTRSSTSICLRFADGAVEGGEDAERAAAGEITGGLEREGIAYDIGGYRDAPPGLRLWGGATVETADLEALFPWLDWAWEQRAR